jgi:hypothetical protein
VVTRDAGPEAHAGAGKAWLGGLGRAGRHVLRQQTSIPLIAGSTTLRFWLHVDVDARAAAATATDTLTVELQTCGGKPLATVARFSNLDAGGWAAHTVDLSAYRGQTVALVFQARQGGPTPTSFVVDDVSLIAR